MSVNQDMFPVCIPPPHTHTCVYTLLHSSSSPQTVLDFYRLLHAVDQKAPQWVHVDLVCDILYLPLLPASLLVCAYCMVMLKLSHQ